MLNPRIGTVMVKCHDNSSYLENEHARNDCTNLIELPMEENGVQYKFNGCNVPQENGKYRRRNNLNSYNVDHSKISKEQVGENTITLTRRIPNILKNSPKVHKIVKEPSNEVVDTKENIQKAHNSIITSDNSSPEKSYIEAGNNECKRSTRRRKQEHNFIDIWQKSPNWNMYTFVDDKKETKNCKKRKRTRPGKKRKNESRNKLPGLETKKQEENSLPLTLHNISMEEFHVASYLEETKPIDLQDSIDFSSNEIFSNYDLTEYARDFNETFNSSSTIYDSEICENKFDINSIEVHMDEIQCSTLSECWSKNDKEPIYSSNSCCSHCHEDCAAHWIATSEKENILSLRDTVLSDNVVINNSEANCQVNFDCSYLPVVKANINLTNESFNENSLYLNLSEEHNEFNSYVNTENMPKIVSQYNIEDAELSSMDSTISCIEDIEEEILKELNGTETAECSMYDNMDDNFLHELDLALTSLESKEMDASQAHAYTEKDANEDEFQCLLCPLMFLSARTLAMHQAGAHGGMYVILCESCGRLFNRKYHFNRHFIHCGRFKEPYKCDMCTRHYRHKSSLIHHLKLVHGVQYASNLSKTFTCSICNKIYSKFGAFENHTQQHKNDFKEKPETKN